MSQRTILIVEDNEDDVLLAQRALRKAGVLAPVQVVRDGDEAVGYLQGALPDQAQRKNPLPGLILLDLKLPKRSGLEVLQWIRAHPALSTLTVVVFTTSTQDSDLEKAYALGVNSYLKKPATLEATTELLKVTGLYWLTHNELPPVAKRGEHG